MTTPDFKNFNKLYTKLIPGILYFKTTYGDEEFDSVKNRKRRAKTANVYGKVTKSISLKFKPDR